MPRHLAAFFRLRPADANKRRECTERLCQNVECSTFIYAMSCSFGDISVPVHLSFSSDFSVRFSQQKKPFRPCLFICYCLQLFIAINCVFIMLLHAKLQMCVVSIHFSSLWIFFGVFFVCQLRDVCGVFTQMRSFFRSFIFVAIYGKRHTKKR